MSDKALIIFAKAPVKEIVKTRLKGYLSDEARMKLYTWLLERIIRETDRIGLYRTFIAFTPPDRGDYFLSRGYESFPQSDGDLGERMKNAFMYMFERGFRKVIICGVDIPDLTGDIIEEAFRRLDKYDLVFGPTRDGGYYLIGMNPPVKDVFSHVRWSTEWTLSDSLKRAKALGLHVHLMKTLRDIDRPEDLERYWPRHGN